MHERGAYGDVLGDCFGLDSPPTLVSRALRKSRLAVTQLRCDAPSYRTTAPIQREDAFLVALQIRGVPSHQLWVDGRSVSVEPFPPGCTTLYDLARDPIAGIPGPFHCLQFYLPRAALDELAEDGEMGRVVHLTFTHGVPYDDSVVRSLGASLLPALSHPDQANGLFVDHVALALHAHVAQVYGRARCGRHPPRGGLAPWQERRAKGLLDANLDGEIRLADVARACGLSFGYFAHAFRRSTGLAPHRWLLQRRVERAKDLLQRSDLPLAEIALTCGFANQSHLGRVFGRVVGEPPGAWRRRRRS